MAKKVATQKMMRKGGYIRTILQILIRNNGEFASKDIFEQVRSEICPTEDEKVTSRSGRPRWSNYISFLSAGAVKAGWIKKENKSWNLTSLGREQVSSTEDDGLLYRQMKADATSSDEDKGDEEDFILPVEEKASDEIRKFICKMDAYDFQDLAAALLRGMGYDVTFIAPLGVTDGGADIEACSKDKFGRHVSKITVQAKHKQDPSKSVRSDAVRALAAIIGDNHNDIGIFVTTGKIPPKALDRVKHKERIVLIGLEKFISLWVKYYPNMNEGDKARLPLKNVPFLALSQVESS